jgi:hypothetical protein
MNNTPNELQINQLLSQLGQELNIPTLQLDDDLSCFLAFDEQLISIQLIQERIYLTQSVLETPPEAIKTPLFEALLTANLYCFVTNGCTVAYEPDSDTVVLQYALFPLTCTLEELKGALEVLLSTTQLFSAVIKDLPTLPSKEDFDAIKYALKV